MASIRKRGDGREKPWVVSYRDPAGKQHSPTFRLEREAKNFRSKIETELGNGTWSDPVDGAITVADYSKIWLASQTSDPLTQKNSEQRWRLHINPALGDVPLAKLRPSMIQSFLAGMDRAKVAPGYAGTILDSLSSALSAAVDDRRIPANPVKAKSVKRPHAPLRRVIPWEADRVQAVRTALTPHYQGTVDAGAGLGLRQGEAFGLAVENTDFLRHVVHVRLQVRIVGGELVYSMPKGSKERDIPLPDSVAMRLSSHISAHPPVEVTLPWDRPGGKPHTAKLIFTTPAGGAVNRNSFNTRWREALKRAGVPQVRENGFHALRHSFASALLGGGCDIRAVSEYLGHDNPGFTLRVYVHLLQDAPDRMRSAIDRAFSGPDVGRMLATAKNLRS